MQKESTYLSVVLVEVVQGLLRQESFQYSEALRLLLLLT
jgi:hypothetical protein